MGHQFTLGIALWLVVLQALFVRVTKQAIRINAATAMGIRFRQSPSLQ